MLPSPWSAEFRGWKPNFLPGDLEKEAQALYQLVTQVHKLIGPENISSVELFGSSYGAILAPILKVIDLKQNKSIFDKAVTLHAPPVSMMASLDKVDFLIDEVRTNKICTSAVFNVFFMRNVIFADDQTDLNRTAIACSKFVMVKIGFLKNVKEETRGAPQSAS